MIRRLLTLTLLLPSLAWATCDTDAYSHVICADSPTIYYRMSSLGSSETNVGSNQTSGCPTATYNNSPTQGVQGIVGAPSNGAVTFASASSQYLAAGAACNGTGGPSMCSFGTPSDLTVEAWIKPTSAAFGQIASFGKGSNYQWQFYTFSGNVKVFLQQTGGATYEGSLTSTTTMTNGTWYFAALRFTAATTKLEVIVNGASEASTTTASGTCGTGAQLTVARLGDGTLYQDATIDEVAIFSTALSNARLTAHYNAGITAPTTHRHRPFLTKLEPWSPREWFLAMNDKSGIATERGIQ